MSRQGCPYFQMLLRMWAQPSSVDTTSESFVTKMTKIHLFNGAFRLSCQDMTWSGPIKKMLSMNSTGFVINLCCTLLKSFTHIIREELNIMLEYIYNINPILCCKLWYHGTQWSVFATLTVVWEQRPGGWRGNETRFYDLSITAQKSPVQFWSLQK